MLHYRVIFGRAYGSRVEFAIVAPDATTARTEAVARLLDPAAWCWVRCELC